MPLLGMTVGQVLLYEAVLLPIILFHHGNVGVPAGADRWLIGVAWMHWMHHSDYQPETDPTTPASSPYGTGSSAAFA